MNITIAGLSRTTTETFLDELFGVEEKIMLSKRLAAIVMCIEGNSSYKIWKKLKLSPSTSERIHYNYKSGAYRHIEKIFKEKPNDFKRFSNMLEIILNAGMSPRGKGRWKRTTRLMNQK